MLSEVLVNVAAVTALAPLIDGVERKVRARLQCRRGPPVLQTWYDLAKLFRRGGVRTGEASFTYAAAPYVVFANLVLALALMPTVFNASLSFAGDVVVLLYLITAASIFLVIGSISSGNPYAVTGSNREVSIAVASKLAVGFAVATFIIDKGSLTLRKVFPAVLPPTASAFIALASLLVVTYIESSRLPFDIPEAEPEIAGGVLIEYSGRELGVVMYSLILKRVVLTTLFIDLLIPRWAPYAPLAYIALVFAIPLAFTCIETFCGRFRIDQALSLIRGLYVVAGVGVALALIGF